MSGRGAWPASGLGGTKKYKDGTKSGPYYYLGTGQKVAYEVDKNGFAVWRAVVAYQRALNRRLNGDIPEDGVFGPITSEAVLRFQTANREQTGDPWGGIGPETSRALLYPDLQAYVRRHEDERVTENMVSGTIAQESLWDAGAVGFLDDTDLGLAQINGPSHPTLSPVERLYPVVAFDFVCNYYTNALNALDGNVRDSVAAYNLGIGGARQWIAAGRPDLWSPTPGGRVREVKKYIDTILKG